MPRQNQSTKTIKSDAGRERSILSALKEIVHNVAEIYYILWKYCPDAIPDGEKITTYTDLIKAYPKEHLPSTESEMQKCLLKDNVQAGVRYLMKRIDGKRDIELYNKYFNLSMNGDVQALKAYMEFKKEFFSDSETNELKAIINGVTFSDNDDEEDFKFE